MAGSPKYKVFDPQDTYQASCKQLKAAGCVAFHYGPGSTIRISHSKKWVIFTVSSAGEPSKFDLESLAREAADNERRLSEESYRKVHGKN